jgi:hypothetical protein
MEILLPEYRNENDEQKRKEERTELRGDRAELGQYAGVELTGRQVTPSILKNNMQKM